MTSNLFPSRTPHFNHVAMSVPVEQLDAPGRQDICAFYDDVFGWVELPTMTVDRRRLVLSAHSYEQFVFLVADDEPMTCPRMDHFGVSVGALAELHAAHARACAHRQDDPRVDVIDPSVEDHEVVKIHSFYVRYLLPLMVEVQHWEFPQDRASAAAGPGR
jgi:hypothetical protein